MTFADADLELASRYAAAYAAFDEAVLEEVLAPDLQFRQVNPGGFLHLKSAEDYLGATRDFLGSFSSHAAGVHRAERVGDRIATASRLHLEAGGSSYVMEHQEFVYVQEGRVVAIDSVCTGARPKEGGS